ncbi:MAG: signal peptide peptidase SppA [bacterium]|nr:signal peptide peptidase SppA [bacterium]
MSRARGWVLGFLLLAIIGAYWFQTRPMGVEPGSVVVIQLQGSYADAPANPLLARLTGRGENSLTFLLGELAKLERDERVDTVVFRIRSLSLGWGRVEEIREAIARLAKKGRKTVAYLEVEGFGNGSYVVATAAERIVAAPGHRNPFVGLAGEYLFLGGLFEKLGVEIEYERIGRYKSAVESYAKKEMSEPAREMQEALVDSIQERFLEIVAEGRGLEPSAISKAIDQAPTGGEPMIRLGLIDEIKTWKALMDGFGEQPVLKASDYAQVGFDSLDFEPEATFALVHGSGPVLIGKGQYASGGSPVLASDTVARALREAAEDPEVQAIVFRINSPGGSALASDIVWQAVQDVRKKGKPVIASMSDVAASGGYYVAAGADKIVSHHTTYTGSIGVFVLRPVIGGLLEKLGVGVETITRGPHAGLLLGSEPLSDETRAVLRDDVEGVYELFLERVAEGRGLERDAVDAIARGRVWTGAQALEIGLVDSLGGLRDAVVEAKRLVDLEDDAPVVLVQYPRPRPLAEELMELFGGIQSAIAPELPLPGTLGSLVRLVRVLPVGAPLLVPPGLMEVH